MRIESIRLKNFRMFRDVSIDHLPNFCVFVGANGTGKSSLFGLFGFLRDALTYNVKEALAKRGGFQEVASRQTPGAMEIELKFRELKSTSAVVTYLLVIDLLDQRPVIQRELLKYRSNQRGGGPRHFIDFSLGKGFAIPEKGPKHKEEVNQKPIEQQLESPDLLALKGLGQFQQFKVASEIRRFIENWHISDFQRSEVRMSERVIGYDEHLSCQGDNLALFARYLQDNQPETYQKIMQEMARRIPGFSHIDTTLEGERIYLKLWQTAFPEPFLPWQVSAGTLTLFAYSLLLHDPKPRSLLCVEEPEKQIYPDLLMGLAGELRAYTKKDAQVFVSTHSPDFLDGVHLPEIFWLTHQEDGSSQVHSATDNHLLKSLTEVGDLPGELWSQGFFRGAHP
jgi:predicted ATPase